MQFTLSSLLLAFLVVALSLAVFGTCGVAIGPIVVAIVVYVRRADSRWRTLVNVGLVLGLIGLGLYEYHRLHHALPSVRECDSMGKPLHSWRVLLLPQVEQESLFRQYDRSEPWDGPKNGKLRIPLQIYQCPSDSADGSEGMTSYIAVVGPDGNWLDAGPRQGSDRPTEHLNPVRVVETCGLGIAWTEPQDISLDDFCRMMSEPSASGQCSKHVREGNFFHYDQPLGAHAVFADGMVRLVSPGVPEESLRAALLGDRECQTELSVHGEPQVNWPNCAALASLVTCIGAMLAWPKPRRT